MDGTMILSGVAMVAGSYYFWTAGRHRRLIGRGAIIVLYFAPIFGVYAIIKGLFGG